MASQGPGPGQKDTKPTPQQLPAAPLVPVAGTAPVIPTTWLAPDEQRRVVVWAVGLVEVMKVWDILAPHLVRDLPATLSSSLRVRGPWSASAWTIAEIAALAAVALLRIPGLAPAPGKIAMLVPVLMVWNAFCWFLAEPLSFIPHIGLFGPVHLGEEGYFWGTLYFLYHMVTRVTVGEPDHIKGVHTIRLLPYSTATLNPLSLTYCIPPNTHEPVYIPIVFNNSAPDQVAYKVRSLVNAKSRTESVSASAMKRPIGWQALRLTDDDDLDLDESETVAEIVARSKQLDLERLHSVRPPESLSVIPRDISPTEHILFLTVDEPSVIKLTSVVDKNRDRFNIAPHREAVVIECPSGGDFSTDDGTGVLVPLPNKPVEPEVRCVGSEEVLHFQARGVAPLKVAWKRSLNGRDITSGVIEGIEDEAVVEALVDGSRDRVSKTHTVPLRVQHDLPGKSTVTLTSVVDALGNTYTPMSRAAVQEFDVVGRRSVAFQCRHPIALLVDGKATLPLAVDSPLDKSSPELKVAYSFTPTSGDASTHWINVDSTTKGIDVTQPGRFTLLEVGGTCAGAVIEPSQCSAVLIPPPAVEMSATTLHECAMNVGMTVNFEFTGTPPFHIEMTEQRQGGRAKTQKLRFESPSGQQELRPREEGKYTYTFASLSDRHYTNRPPKLESLVQVVHPSATVDVVSKAKEKLWSCSGDVVNLELAVKGNDPLKLTYRTSHGFQTEDFTVPVKSGKQSLLVPVPAELLADGGATGTFHITIVSVEDGKGCVKRLQSRSVEVDIDRRRPTARFTRYDSVVVREGEVVEAPLRLSGQPAWRVQYSLDGKPQPEVPLGSANSVLRLEQRGVYKLLSVRDNWCPGEVDVGTFAIDYKPLPRASLAESGVVSRQGDVYTHKGLCAGEEDAVAVRFTGASPFDLDYKYQLDGGKAATRALKSAQTVGVLHLDGQPGRHRYEFNRVSDSIYSRVPVHFTLEHEVFTRPSAKFVRQNTQSLCRDSPLVTDARVRLSGKAPFVLTLGLRAPASADVVEHVVELSDREWRVEIPAEMVKEVGQYEITLLGVADASGCGSVWEDKGVLATTVDVVETAVVVPISHERNLCVGDTLDFLLQGKAPWIVEYTWHKRTESVTSSASRFSRFADAPGTFTIHSVALKDRQGQPQCRRIVDDLERIVHPLPGATIEDGIDSLREGDQPATFKVLFRGTPPYTFTYTRSERMGGRSRIVESQTITDIWNAEYTISSSAPGDYEVTSVADKYCRYPPLSVTREA